MDLIRRYTAWVRGLASRFVEFFPPTHPIRELRLLFEPLIVALLHCVLAVCALCAPLAVCQALASMV